MKHVIYGLCEPGTKFVWYVGDTKFPVEERLEGHLVESRDNNTCHRHRWLRSLVRDGLRPAIVVLEQVTSANWEARERHWIAKLKKPNRLVNSTNGGEGLISPSRYLRRRIARKVSLLLQGNQRAVGMPHSKEQKEKFRLHCQKMWAPDG